jgi:hypothetical protein
MAPKRKTAVAPSKAKKAKTDQSALVKWACLKITTTSMHEFDDDKINASCADWNKAGFKVQPGEVESYHDGPECDTIFRFDYKGDEVSLDALVDRVWDIYSKHHADFHWFHLLVCTDDKVYDHEWHVFRYRNLGIMRTLEDVKKHIMYSYIDGVFELDKDSGKIAMVKLAGKDRPFRKKVEEYDLTKLHDLERVSNCFDMRTAPDEFQHDIEAKIDAAKEEEKKKALQVMAEFAARPGHLLAKRAVERCKNTV